MHRKFFPLCGKTVMPAQLQKSDPKVLLFVYRPADPLEGFVKRHVEHVAGGYGNCMHLQDWRIPQIGEKALWKTDPISCAVRKVLVRLFGIDRKSLHKKAFGLALRRRKPDVVLAEFGYSGILILDVCQELCIPLVVHFHGSDVNRQEVITLQHDVYLRMFAYASSMVTTSLYEKNALVAQGAPPEKLHVVPSGADFPKDVKPAPRNGSDFNILSVTRMAEVKAPHLTIVAFRRYLDRGGKGRLQIVGDGPLMPFCQSLARGLGLGDKCVFRGRLPNEEVLRLVGEAHLYVQHSIRARDGDCEGMPRTIMEAAGYQLPIVTTAPGGIGEFMKHGETAYVVDEYDTAGMAECMYRLWRDPKEAQRLGKAAHTLACAHFVADERAAKVKELTHAAVASGRATASWMVQT